eukprot:TRINITY_DN6177_c0_g2_i2.p1 TRINITY_DN6177_c0_g2~~TRINITY_DN6177_c0_g2_i2.p1  ORF type:complete len:490 (-),score=189.81 TRINITY_DN6177_c0_g2_i2:973-2442(-)
MMSFSSSLPAPVREYKVLEEQSWIHTAKQNAQASVPRYGQRHGFVPRSIEDYGNGGAFPELVSVGAQYPLNLGRPGRKRSQKAAVNEDAVVHSSYVDALVEKRMSDEDLRRPDEDEIRETAERTRRILEANQADRLAATKEQIPKPKKNVEKFINYKPNRDAPGFNKAAGRRVIRMVEEQEDPLEPPRFKHKKAPRGPGEAPAPVMQSPPRKLTQEDQNNWKIPPCVSNWKNPKGHVIPLDQRLLVDGRSAQQVTINPGFASLSETLAMAERNMKEETALRAGITKRLAQQAKAAEEDALRKKAEEARKQRRALIDGGSKRSIEERKREELLNDRKYEIEREYRMKKNSKLARDLDRDISEKVALGQHVAVNAKNEVQYDARLFNQNSGLDSGFGDESEYNLYSKDLFATKSQSIYRPRADGSKENADEMYDKLTSTKRFKADKGFKGASAPSSDVRDEPVQFQRDEPSSSRHRDSRHRSSRDDKRRRH